MKIVQVRILNFKGYLDSGWIPIAPNRTVIVGQNSAGKSAFLEALAGLRNKPFVAPRQPGELPAVLNPISKAEVDLITSGPEVSRQFLVTGNSINFAATFADANDIRNELENFFLQQRILWNMARTQQEFSGRQIPAHDHYPSAKPHIAQITPKPDRQGWTTPGRIGGNVVDQWPVIVSELYQNSVFVFRAERLNIGTSQIDNSAVLHPDASNLPSVMLQLQGIGDVYDRYRELVRQIFPSIYNIAAKPISQNQVQVFITNRDSNAPNRAAATLPLSECGTGISQVLAILYVVITAEFPRVIVIDEPNSFLHPGAARKLLQILRDFPHQYIVSTHSSDVISALDPETINLVAWENNSSVVHSLNRDSADSQRIILDGLGVRLSDVFGADNVLWVEGPTEERCFPLLLNCMDIPLLGTAIVPLVATSDLDVKGPRGDLILQIYERLSKGGALVPPALGICLDLEDRTAIEIEDLKRRSQGMVKFLPRRCYENYLLHPQAISVVINAAIIKREPVSEAKVEAWLEGHRTDRKYYSNDAWARRSDENWNELINAPKILSDIFTDMSGASVAFNKVTHSVQLTKWLLKNERHFLDELLLFVRGLVEK